MSVAFKEFEAADACKLVSISSTFSVPIELPHVQELVPIYFSIYELLSSEIL